MNKRKMRIKVIFTGGTIGSKINDGFIRPNGAPMTIIENYKKQYDNDCEFETLEPFEILSEEITGDYMLLLGRCVRQALDDSDAVIITHGTDTIAYTSAFLGYTFSEAKKPIILVSSGYPLDDKRSNGNKNFEAAVSLAYEQIGGVYAVWFDEKQTHVHLGTRLLQQAPYSDKLTSVDNRYFGTIEQGKFYPNEYGQAENHGVRLFLSNNLRELKTLSGFGSVLDLPCRPNMYYPALTNEVSAVLLESYHSGTLCADERFMSFINEAKRLDIPVFLSGANGRDTDYETVKKYREAGVFALPVASPAAMYVKLSLIASIGADAIELMKLCCGGDYI